jgi:hypothetical protein
MAMGCQTMPLPSPSSSNASSSGAASRPAQHSFLTYNSGTQVALTAVPAPRNRFAGWAGACRGTTNPCIVMMNNHRAVIATFRR